VTERTLYEADHDCPVSGASGVRYAFARPNIVEALCPSCGTCLTVRKVAEGGGRSA
jgi:hypothetical protein